MPSFDLALRRLLCGVPDEEAVELSPSSRLLCGGSSLMLQYAADICRLHRCRSSATDHVRHASMDKSSGWVADLVPNDDENRNWILGLGTFAKRF